VDKLNAKNVKLGFWVLFGLSAAFAVFGLFSGSNAIRITAVALMIVFFIGLVISDRKLNKKPVEKKTEIEKIDSETLDQRVENGNPFEDVEYEIKATQKNNSEN